MAPALPFTLRAPGGQLHSGTPDAAWLTFHMGSPKDHGVMPSESPPPPLDHVPCICTPEFSAQTAPSSLAVSAQVSSQVYPPKTNQNTGLGGRQEQPLRVSDMDAAAVVTHVHTLHGAGQSWKERRGAARSLGSICTQGPDPTHVLMSLSRVKGWSQNPPCPPELLSDSITPPALWKNPHILVLTTHLYLHNLQGPVQNETPLVQKARKAHG